APSVLQIRDAAARIRRHKDACVAHPGCGSARVAYLHAAARCVRAPMPRSGGAWGTGSRRRTRDDAGKSTAAASACGTYDGRADGDQI
ncbi:unnamed protein product, partial [Urochloa humidicola]